MRSTSVMACALAAQRARGGGGRIVRISVNLFKRQPRSRGRRRERRVGAVEDGIAWHISSQKLYGFGGADLADAGELDLEHQRGRGDLGRGLQALHHEAEHPAAGVVFRARETLEQPVVENGVIVAPDAVPAAADRPLSGDVDLSQDGALVAVARVQDLRYFRRVPERNAVLLRRPSVGVVLRGHVKGRGARATADRCEHVGLARVAKRRVRRQADTLVAEIEPLAKRGAQPFLAVLLQEAGGYRGGELVGVAEAVAADEAVL